MSTSYVASTYYYYACVVASVAAYSILRIGIFMMNSGQRGCHTVVHVMCIKSENASEGRVPAARFRGFVGPVLAAVGAACILPRSMRSTI